MHESVEVDASFYEVGFTKIFGKSLMLLDLDFPNLVKNGIPNYLGFLILTLWVLHCLSVPGANLLGIGPA